MREKPVKSKRIYLIKTSSTLQILNLINISSLERSILYTNTKRRELV